MLFTTAIAMEFLVASILLIGTGSARPLESEDYRQYQNSGGNSYTPPLLSAGAFGGSQSAGFSPLVNPSVFMPQSIPPSAMNSYGNPFAGQSFGASSYGAPGGFGGGLPNYYG